MLAVEDITQDLESTASKCIELSKPPRKDNNDGHKKN